MRFPNAISLRPSYPVKAEFVLGFMMAAWGAWLLVNLPVEHHAGKSWSWLLRDGTLVPVSAFALALGAFKMVCALRRWITGGKAAAFVAFGLWVQFAYKAAEDAGSTPFIAVCWVGAIGSAMIFLAVDKIPK